MLAYCGFALGRHWIGLSGGWDLGIFAEAVKGYAHFSAPIADLKGWDYNLLGDHFHPILILLVPLWWLLPRPESLLVAQALLIAGSALIVGRFAAKRLGRRVALAVTLAYGLSFGVLHANAFDFHEVAFAAPIMALVCVALAEERWRAAVGWASALLLVKEDFGLTLVAVGAYLFLRRQRRLGVAVAVGGIAAFVLVLTVVLPVFNAHGTFDYWTVFGAGTHTAPGSQRALALLAELPVKMFWPPVKLLTLGATFGITTFIALRSPLVLLALPTLAWRFVGDKDDYWGIGMHYSLVLMPIVFVAYIVALPRMRSAARPWVRRWASWSVPLLPVIAVVGLLVGSVAAYIRYPKPTADHRAAVSMLVARVPDGARVSASRYIAPHLVARARVATFPGGLAGAQWALIDSATDTDFPTAAARDTYIAHLSARGMRLVDSADSVRLYRRG